MVPDNRRVQAVSRLMLGLTVATIIGVPASNWLGQAAGWRWGFGVVTVLGVITMALVALFAPMDRPHPDTSPLRELGALRLPQVWLTLGIGGRRIWRHVRRLHLSGVHADGGDALCRRRWCRWCCVFSALG